MRARRDPPLPFTAELFQLGDPGNEVLQLAVPDHAVQRIDHEPPAVAPDAGITQQVGKDRLGGPDRKSKDGEQHEHGNEPIQLAEPTVTPGDESEDGNDLDGHPGDHLRPAQQERCADLLPDRQLR